METQSKLGLNLKALKFFFFNILQSYVSLIQCFFRLSIGQTLLILLLLVKSLSPCFQA